jgi:hypothetical protein
MRRECSVGAHHAGVSRYGHALKITKLTGMEWCSSLKAATAVQIRSGLQELVQVRGLVAGHGGQALIICH